MAIDPFKELYNAPSYRVHSGHVKKFNIPRSTKLKIRYEYSPATMILHWAWLLETRKKTRDFESDSHSDSQSDKQSEVP